MSEAPTVGLHGPAYISREVLEAAKREVALIVVRDALGDKIGALERIAYLILKQNDYV